MCDAGVGVRWKNDVKAKYVFHCERKFAQVPFANAFCMDCCWWRVRRARPSENIINKNVVVIMVCGSAPSG
jgi:hypothetical protein